jgi:thiol-disulfide isomerase/thioredoxin
MAVVLVGVVTVGGCRIESEDEAAGRKGGSAAPAFTLEDLGGTEVSLESLRGRPVVLDFWATWCSPCVFQIPVLNEFHERHRDRVEVIGVAVDVDGREVVAPFAAEHSIAYPVLLGTPDLAQRYGAMGFPTLYVIDPEGVIASAHVGVVDAEQLEASVAAALAP